MSKPASQLIVAPLLAALLAACSTAPTHSVAALAVPEAFSSPDALASPTPAADSEFWRVLGDPMLDTLVADALAANLDLRQAVARLDEARALSREADGERWPGLRLGAGATDSRASADQSPGSPRADRDSHGVDASARVDWEPDLFGRLRHAARAGRAEVGATASDLAALQVAVVADVVDAYVALRGAQQRLDVARANLLAQEETRDLVERGFVAGRGTAFDTARARAQAQGTAARLPPLQAQTRVLAHRLAVLTGRTPESLDAHLLAAGALPAVPPAIAPGTPGELLRRRPDVAAAEQRLQAALARGQSARAELFPRFSLAALIGSQAGDAGGLFQRDAETHAYALGIDWSFLDRARVRSRIDVADARADGAEAAYRQAVLEAIEDTANALERRARAVEEDARLDAAMRDSAEAARLARLRRDAGAGTLLEVLEAERNRLEAEDAAVLARVRSLSGSVALYRALAGGWPAATPPPLARR